MERLSYINALKRAFLMLEKQHQDQDSARYLLLELTGWNWTQFSLHQKDLMPTTLQKVYQQDIDLVAAGWPAQYVLGYAWFYGRKFKVSSDTLIPRQDSEAMIAQILQDNPTAVDLLELGTGSGALVITLGLKGNYQNLTATDISPAAVKIARQNSHQYHLPIKFVIGDLFQPVRGQQFDLIVFNPPYIATSEIELMDSSLVFYRRVFSQIEQFLKPQGKIYLEFGFQQQEKISRIFQGQLPNWQIDFFHDVANHPRFLRLQRKEVKK